MTEKWTYTRDDQNLRDSTLQQIAEDLQGTCRSISEILEWYELEESDMDQGDYIILEEMVMLCDHCGWWYETGEVETDDGETICWHCKED